MATFQDSTSHEVPQDSFYDRPASSKAINFLRKLCLSSAIPSEQAQATLRYLDSGNATVERVCAGIEWAKGRIASRDADRAASKERKAAYRSERHEYTGAALASKVEALFPAD